MQEVDGRPAAQDDDQDTGHEAKDCAERLPVRAVVSTAVEFVVAGKDLFDALEARGGFSGSVCGDERGGKLPGFETEEGEAFAGIDAGDCTCEKGGEREDGLR